ncbi:hypothetical protein Aple_074650 [Acrocarpospora pleiomorpha]|uniref:Uncharacterized protein n=1 Tax=Acrocarpospora pleiomorpha TaxID=90975 RepID=A0A5M3XUK2_9ACTN|nr:hypothetical protein [Acrocarpospora pleiomorpha]GES24566.1 hypothetical protein Aple_074650 [Acrocarpospora pleiomorpha]
MGPPRQPAAQQQDDSVLAGFRLPAGAQAGPEVVSELIPVGVNGVISVAYLFRGSRLPVMSGTFSLGRFDLAAALGACWYWS